MINPHKNTILTKTVILTKVLCYCYSDIKVCFTDINMHYFKDIDFQATSGQSQGHSQEREFCISLILRSEKLLLLL